MTVISLPVRRVADQNLALLTEVAVHPTARRYPRVPPLVRDCAWSGHTDTTLAAAWLEFKDAVLAREKVTIDGDAWRVFFDASDCAGTDHALELLSARITDAYRVIRFGSAGAR